MNNAVKISLNIILPMLVLIGVQSCSENKINLAAIEKERALKAADNYLKEEPVTVTSSGSERSSGGLHDYYSEGDYWWPDPENPGGAYIRKDGLTNPDNFTAHRKALRRFSIQVAALVAAYKITGESKYAEHALKHINAWFIDSTTLMNPNLLYAQAISGKVPGRGIGIIDTIHLVEVVQSIIVLEQMKMISDGDLVKVKAWFSEYLKWLTTHQFGIDERDNGNNHSTCWVMQAGMYAKFVNDTASLSQCVGLYKKTLLPDQMEVDGSFPLELKRTKPYGYSLFNLDAMVMVCQILSDGNNNLWEFRTDDGKSIKQAVEFMYPYILDKSKWPFGEDVMYFDEWPVRHPALLFAGLAYNENKYIELWKSLNADPVTDEVIRNYPIRQPILWINEI